MQVSDRMSFGSSLQASWLGMRPIGRQKTTDGAPLGQEESRFWTKDFQDLVLYLSSLPWLPKVAYSYSWSPRCHGLLGNHSRYCQQQEMEEGRQVFSRIFTQLKIPAMEIYFLGKDVSA